MPSRRKWKDAALASTLALVWMPLGCGETPPTPPTTAASTPATAPEAPVKASKGKKRGNPDQDLGIAEKREMRRKAAQAAGGAP